MLTVVLHKLFRLMMFELDIWLEPTHNKAFQADNFKLLCPLLSQRARQLAIAAEERRYESRAVYGFIVDSIKRAYN